MSEVQGNGPQGFMAEWRERARSALGWLAGRRVLLLASLALVLSGALGLGYYWHHYKKGSLTLVNLRPCSTAFAVHRPATASESVTEGWWTLKAGEQMTLEREFVGVEPRFAVYAESRCPEQTRWVYQLPQDDPGIIYFEGDAGDTVSFLYIRPESRAEAQASPAAGSQPAFEEDAHRTARMEVRLPSRAEAAPESGNELVGFVEAPAEGSSRFKHVFIEKELDGLYDKRGLSEDDDEENIKIISARAVLLETSLERQRRYDEDWPNPGKSFPYDLGLELEDHNGLDVPGVLVKEVVYGKSLFGDDVPFQAGDIIVGLDGETVFSGRDLNVLLYEHATSLEKGIEVPAEVKVVRGEQVLVLKTLYFFNQNFWGTQSKLEAAGAGALNTLAFGGGATAEVLARKAGRGLKSLFKWATGDKTEEPPPPEFKGERWEVAQRNARYQQFEPGAYEVGSIAGLFAPSAPRLIFGKALARSLARRGVPRLAAMLAASTTLEVAEGVMWTVGDASPLRTPEQIAEDVRKITPYAAAAGVVTGALNRRALRR